LSFQRKYIHEIAEKEGNIRKFRGKGIGELAILILFSNYALLKMYRERKTVPITPWTDMWVWAQKLLARRSGFPPDII
jgi:hypothetical protein